MSFHFNIMLVDNGLFNTMLVDNGPHQQIMLIVTAKFMDGQISKFKN